MTGTTVAQVIPIAAAPILTRIYTPEDFGLYALFIAIASIFGSVATGRYELAVMLPKRDECAINIFALGFLITIVISLVLLLLVVLFNDYFIVLLNNDEIGFWLYFIPISVFFTGLFNILNYFNIRNKNYKDIANSTIARSVALVIIQLCVGFMKQGASGLISGQMLSQMLANLRLFKNIAKDKFLISKVSKTKMITLAKKYKDFPKFSMWGILANTLSMHLINILISSFFSIATLGVYTLVQRFLGVPSLLIGKSIGQVFFQQATKEKNETGTAINAFDGTVKKLIIISLPLFGMLFFIAEDLFVFAFGVEWRMAGTYAEIVMPLFFIRFIVSAVSAIDTVMERQNIFLLFNVILLVASFSLIYMFKNDKFVDFLMAFSITIGFIYLSYAYILRLMANNKLNFWRV